MLLLCVVGMVSGEDNQSELENVPVVLYGSAVWEHFRFSVSYKNSSRKGVNKSVIVCKQCFQMYLAT